MNWNVPNHRTLGRGASGESVRGNRASNRGRYPSGGERVTSTSLQFLEAGRL